jgi:RimJ/RimL family protein N-acetyltransferase
MPSSKPPRVKTSRLVMRSLEEGDLAAYAAMTGDPNVMRFVSDGHVFDEGQAWREIATHLGHWELRGYGQWALELGDEGGLIGRAGLWNPAGWPGIEVGWMLSRDAWGNGYATEAGEASIRWAWENLDASELISVIHPRNEASMRVARRLGMEPRSESTLRGQSVVIFGLEKPPQI